MCEIGLLYPKTVKEMKKKRRVRGQKPGFGAGRNGFLAFFLSGCFCQKCRALKVAYDFNFPIILFTQKPFLYKNESI